MDGVQVWQYLDLVITNADSTKASISHGRELREHIEELTALLAIFFKDVDIGVPILCRTLVIL